MNKLTNRPKLRFILLSLLILLIFISVNNFIIYKANAETDTKSLIADWFNPVFQIELTNGSTLFDSGDERESINNEIYNDESNKTYSLYDRFGGDINFIPYFGETKIQINVIDKLYDLYCNNIDDFYLTLDDLKKFFNGVDAVSNNCVYENRPNILSGEAIKNGNIDPRVSAYHGVSYVGGDAALGNLMLKVSIIITSFTSWASGSGIYNTINGIITKISETSFMDLVSTIVKYLLPMAGIVSIILLISRIIKNIKGVGQNTIKKIATDGISFVLSLGIIYALLVEPMYFSSIYNNIITMMDSIFDESLSNNSNEVIKSDNLENVRSATLWYTSVFNPWCEGMFGDKYDNLYTQYSDKDSKLYQDNDVVSTNWSDDSIHYNSVNLTGDISIPIGNGESIKNWAALAYSCQSIYHIDSVEGAQNAGITLNTDSWPKATLTPHNTNIYVDNFRWLDAKLNVSPEYKSSKDIYMSYSNSNQYDEYFISAGRKSIFYSLMLFPILFLSFRKIKSIMLLVFSGFRLMYYSFMNFINKDRYNIITNIKNTLKPIIDYFWWSMTIFLSISFYKNLVGENYLTNIIYLILALYLNFTKPITIPYQVKRLAKFTKNQLTDLKKSIKK